MTINQNCNTIVFARRKKNMKFVLSKFMHKQFASFQTIKLAFAVFSIPDGVVSEQLEFLPGKARAMSLT